MAKNSAPKMTNKAPELKKAKIKKSTECTGFREDITITALAVIINENR